MEFEIREPFIRKLENGTWSTGLTNENWHARFV